MKTEIWLVEKLELRCWVIKLIWLPLWVPKFSVNTQFFAPGLLYGTKSAVWAVSWDNKDIPGMLNLNLESLMLAKVLNGCSMLKKLKTDYFCGLIFYSNSLLKDQSNTAIHYFAELFRHLVSESIHNSHVCSFDLKHHYLNFPYIRKKKCSMLCWIIQATFSQNLSNKKAKYNND